MVIPKDISELGIIIEFKKINELSKETIDTAAQEALKQIKENKYEQELTSKGIENIIKLAIVFKVKKLILYKKRI